MPSPAACGLTLISPAAASRCRNASTMARVDPLKLLVLQRRDRLGDVDAAPQGRSWLVGALRSVCEPAAVERRWPRRAPGRAALVPNVSASTLRVVVSEAHQLGDKAQAVEHPPVELVRGGDEVRQQDLETSPSRVSVATRL